MHDEKGMIHVMLYNDILIFNLLIVFLISLITFNFLLEKKLYVKFSYKLKILMEITFFIMLLGLILSLILMDLTYHNTNTRPSTSTMIYTCLIVGIYSIFTFKRLRNFKKANKSYCYRVTR